MSSAISGDCNSPVVHVQYRVIIGSSIIVLQLNRTTVLWLNGLHNSDYWFESDNNGSYCSPCSEMDIHTIYFNEDF